MSAKILIVDDEPSARFTLENLLFSEGYSLQFASNAAEGLVLARTWQPDVILSDVMMPGQNGFEFCRALREDANLGPVPVILITALDDRQAKLSGLQAGADDFISKPIDSLELRVRLRTLTRLDRFRKLNDERVKLEEAHRDLVQTHEALRVSDERFRNFIEQSADGLVLTDEQGGIVEWNQALAQITGVTREQALSLAVWDIQFQLNPPENQFKMPVERLKNVGQKILHNGHSPLLGQIRDLEIQTTYGPRRFIQQNTFIIHTTSGHCLGAVIRDVTERKQLAQQLEAEATRRRILFEESPDGILIIDPATAGFVEFNTTAHTQLGYTRAEFAQLHIDEVEAQESAAETRAHIAEVIRSGKGDFETVQRTKQGELRNVHVTAQIVYIMGHMVYYCTWRDITDRKRAEAARRESDERYHLLFQTMVQGVVFQDAQGHIIQANPAAERVLGLTLDQMQGRTSIDPRWHAIQEDGAPFPGETHPAMVALQTGQRVYNTVMGVFNPAAGAYCWLNINAAPRFRPGEAKPYQVYTTFEDITERKLAETQLRRNEQILRLFVEHSPAAIAMFDRDMRYVVVSQRFLTDYRLGHQSLIGRSHYEVFPEMTDDRKAIHRRSLAGEVVKCEEDPLPRLDGQVDWVRYELRPWYEETGDIGGVIFFSEVITERKQIEQALRETQFRQEMALKGANAGTWDWNVQTGAATFNERWASMLGYTLAELEPINIETWVKLCHPDDLVISDRLLQEHFAGKTEYYECEARMKHKNGSWVWVVDQGRVMDWDAAGQPLRMFGTHLDISARKAADQALRASEEKYRGLLESLDSAVAMIDGEGRFAYLNEVAARQLGGTPEQFTGKVMHDLFPEPVASRQLQGVQEVIATNQPHISQLQSVVQGQVRWYRSSLQPIHDEHGRTVQVLLNTTDITPIMTVQVQLEELNRSLEERVAQRTQELADANDTLAAMVDRLQDLDRLKSKFVSDVSHELRTPVTSLSLYIDLLEHGKPEKREQYVGKLKEQMARVHKLINDILDLSRLERDRDEATRIVVDINSIVEHITAMEHGAAEMAGLTLICEVADGIPQVVARPDQLTRAVTNLVANAIKYTPAGWVRVRTLAQAGRVGVQVQDSGPGIAPEDVPHLFDRFYRGKAAAQTKVPGTGLGLAIVKEIAEMHGGSVEVESVPGQGSTFRLWLPAVGA